MHGTVGEQPDNPEEICKKDFYLTHCKPMGLLRYVAQRASEGMTGQGQRDVLLLSEPSHPALKPPSDCSCPYLPHFPFLPAQAQVGQVAGVCIGPPGSCIGSPKVQTAVHLLTLPFTTMDHKIHCCKPWIELG